MKKVLSILLTLMLGLASWQLSAQQIVEILGDAGTTTNSYLPCIHSTTILSPSRSIRRMRWVWLDLYPRSLSSMEGRQSLPTSRSTWSIPTRRSSPTALIGLPSWQPTRCLRELSPLRLEPGLPSSSTHRLSMTESATSD